MNNYLDGTELYLLVRFYLGVFGWLIIVMTVMVAYLIVSDRRKRR